MTSEVILYHCINLLLNSFDGSTQRHTSHWLQVVKSLTSNDVFQLHVFSPVHTSYIRLANVFQLQGLKKLTYHSRHCDWKCSSWPMARSEATQKKTKTNNKQDMSCGFLPEQKLSQNPLGYLGNPIPLNVAQEKHSSHFEPTSRSRHTGCPLPMLPATAFDVDQQLVHLKSTSQADANQKLVIHGWEVCYNLHL